jgi:hypothetical protein
MQTYLTNQGDKMTHTFYGPLHRHPTNPRYFTDNSGRAIYLTGSHTWANLQDIGQPGRQPFPYAAWLDFMEAHHHNFMRLWMFEQPSRASWTAADLRFDPLPWARTGPSLAKDGLPKFNLAAWNEEYFSRMRQRIIQAGERGIYCAVMLFQGWSLHKTSTPSGDPWPVHPFNGENNINGVDVPYHSVDDDEHPCLHSTLNPAVLAHQEAYVRKVIDTVNDLDNVLYEILNEGGATAWQYYLIDFIHAQERERPKQHPVGMTHRISPWQFNSELFDSPADWISPAREPHDWKYPGSVVLHDYIGDPPAADGSKVIINDTDHLWGHGGNPVWVWKSFTRGLNPIFMDPWWPLYIESTENIAPWVFVGGVLKDDPDYPDWAPTRRAMGDTRHYADKMDLVAMTPQPDLVSTRYCLADPGREYLVYLPQGGSVTIDLRTPGRLHDPAARYAVEWFFPSIGRTLTLGKALAGGDYAVTTAPYTGDAVLYLKRIPDEE